MHFSRCVSGAEAAPSRCDNPLNEVPFAVQYRQTLQGLGEYGCQASKSVESGGNKENLLAIRNHDVDSPVTDNRNQVVHITGRIRHRGCHAKCPLNCPCETCERATHAVGQIDFVACSVKMPRQVESDRRSGSGEKNSHHASAWIVARTTCLFLSLENPSSTGPKAPPGPCWLSRRFYTNSGFMHQNRTENRRRGRIVPRMRAHIGRRGTRPNSMATDAVVP
jgi:hypothetical protein